MKNDAIQISEPFQQKKPLISSQLDNETVLLDIESGKYFGMKSTAQRIWQLLEDPASPEQIANILQKEYAVEGEKCQQDVINFVQTLYDKKLIHRLSDNV